MSEWAAANYEPTADEIDDVLSDLFPAEVKPGEHGEIVIIPYYERFIWNFPVFWGHRYVDSDGYIHLAYCVPLPCPQEES